MNTSTVPHAFQLDMFGPALPLETPVRTPSKEGLRNGHIVASCGEVGFEYLLAYALKRGLQAGPATKAGKSAKGSLVSLLILNKKVVRADYVRDAKDVYPPELRRLSAARFCRLVDAWAAKKGGAQ